MAGGRLNTAVEVRETDGCGDSEKDDSGSVGGE
jgi:hypothetical protein